MKTKKQILTKRKKVLQYWSKYNKGQYKKNSYNKAIVRSFLAALNWVLDDIA